MSAGVLAQLPGALLPWFAENRRELPWRRDREPYHIWVSEIMLQQTRVEAVKGYYLRFLEALPTVEALAEAPEDQLRKLWQGLGYYNRVMNMKKAAVVLCRDYGGVFPRDRAALLALPGIGAYTAGAIGSIAFDLPTPAVDGNVLRVVARLLDIRTPVETPREKKRIETELEAVYPPGQCGAFTQSIMELGATVCLPNGKPRCGACPCAAFCRGLAQGQPELLPMRLPKRERRRERRTVFVLKCGERYALVKRPERGLLAGLWEFPNVPGHLELPEALAWAQEQGFAPIRPERMVERQHIFTHVLWELRCYYLTCRSAPEGYTWAAREQVDRELALPTAFKQFWDLLPFDKGGEIC